MRKTKTNQGDGTSSALETLHNSHAIITEQEGDVQWPVNSSKHYIDNLNPDCDAFFQYPDKDKKCFENRVVGKNTLEKWWKQLAFSDENN